MQLNFNNRITTSLSNTRVLFDGVPSPLIRVASDQITAIVPTAVSGKSHATAAVERSGQIVATTPVVIGAVSPALLTLDPSGTGQSAAINLDGTINGPSSPAAAGSIITLFAIGMTASSDPDGSLATAAAPVSPTPVVVVGGQLAQVLYAGPSPTMTTALTQINIRLPAELTGQLPVYILATGSSTQYGATLSVK